MQKPLSSSLLTWLRAFDAVARLGSFTRAADELHITQGATSQQIQRLEESLRFQLVDRTTRPMSLTAEGEKLAAVVETAFAQIRETIAEISAPGGAVPITLSCSPSFAMQWLTPRLSELRTNRPSVDIRVFGEFHHLDKAEMSREQLQAAIRYDVGNYPNLRAQCFLDEYLVPVASPGFIAAHPGLSSSGVLPGNWLLHDARPWAGADELSEWQSWLDATGWKCPDLKTGKRFNLAMLAVGAAVAGEGIAIGRTAMIMDELRRGELVALVPLATRSLASYYFVTTPNPSVQTDMIGDWIRAEGKAFHGTRAEVLESLAIRIDEAG
jgi:LysR family transcriptional regulator, glycine cleavage system transcriptional activator